MSTSIDKKEWNIQGGEETENEILFVHFYWIFQVESREDKQESEHASHEWQRQSEFVCSPHRSYIDMRQDP